MTNIQIENTLSQKNPSEKAVTIHFKSRNPVTGLFIRSKDYDELKSKNLWRIVSAAKLQEFSSNQDQSLARIYNGVDFTKIVIK